MAEIERINPLVPAPPLRREEPRRDGDKPSARDNKDRQAPSGNQSEHHIDEYA